MKLSGLVFLILFQCLYVDGQDRNISPAKTVEPISHDSTVLTVRRYFFDGLADPKFVEKIESNTKKRRRRRRRKKNGQIFPVANDQSRTKEATETPIQSYQLPVLDLDSEHLKKQIADHTQRVLDMTTKVLNWENDFNVFSPIGLYKALGMLSLMANKGSSSRNEINTVLGSNDESLTPELMHVWSEYWIKKNDLVFANAFMRPSTFSSIEGTTLKDILNASNTTLLGSETALNKFADRVTQGQIKEIPIKEKENSQVFVNIMMLRFTWLKPPYSTYSWDFFLDSHKLRKKKISYMGHRLTTKYSITNRYKACILPLATKVGGSSAPLAAYIFSFHKSLYKGTLGNEWTAIYNDLKQQKERYITIFVPNAELEQKIEFTTDMFPNLLREDNKDFNPIV
ncbi:hypothetical protein HMI55_001304, partial [Coelomomyces lativittatus]